MYQRALPTVGSLALASLAILCYQITRGFAPLETKFRFTPRYKKTWKILWKEKYPTVANYHFHTKVFSRRKNQSAVAAAAYRSAENLYSEVDKQMKRSKKNKEVTQHAEIFSPIGAPDWASERQSLWNQVELYERNNNRRHATAQLAREVEFSLPRELDLQTNIQLAREFVQEQFVPLGMVADLAIHEKKASDGGMNPHAHVMLTLREISMDGFGKKNRDWNNKALYQSWRQAWADKANEALEDAGETERVSHESYAARGIDKRPQPKLGPKLAAMASKGYKLDKIDKWETHQFKALTDAPRLSTERMMEIIEIARFLDEEEQYHIDKTIPEI